MSSYFAFDGRQGLLLRFEVGVLLKVPSEEQKSQNINKKARKYPHFPASLPPHSSRKSAAFGKNRGFLGKNRGIIGKISMFFGKMVI